MLLSTGGYIENCGQKVRIINFESLKNIPFDYCLIAVKSYQEIMQQCINKLMIPEEKILQATDFTEWDVELLKSIFYEDILGNSRSYDIGGFRLDLGENHSLPQIQRFCKMYDRIVPYLAEMTRKKVVN